MTDRWDKRPYLPRLGDALSQFFNVWMLNGMPDETISGRSYRIVILQARPAPLRWRVIRRVAEAIFWIKDRGNHTELAFWEDVYRASVRAKATRVLSKKVMEAEGPDYEEISN